MNKVLRARVTSLLPLAVREDYRSTRQLVKVQQQFGRPCRTPLGAWMRRVRITTRPKRSLMFYPEVPFEAYVVYKLCAVLGYRVTGTRRGADHIAFHFFSRALAPPQPLALQAAAINGRINDTSKSYVARVFEEVFGYPLALDPTRYTGTALKKSEENGVHDAVLVECPLPASRLEPDCVYQRAIDNRTPDGCFLDLRVAVHGDELPLAYYKYHRPDGRFQRAYARVELCDPHTLFDAAERARILAYARAIGLDFGELDILRDNADGRLYVVDVNNVPVGPRPEGGFTAAQARRAVGILAESFEHLLAGFDGRSAPHPAV